MIYDEALNALPFWERIRGDGPLTRLLKRRAKDRGRKGRVGVDLVLYPRGFDPKTGIMGNGCRWVNYREGPYEW